MKLNNQIKWIILILSLSFQGFAATEIKIYGVDDDIKKNIQLFLATSQLACDAEIYHIDSYIEQLPAKISKATRPFGYYNTEVSVNKQMDSNQCLILELAIELNDPILIKDLLISVTGEGSNDPLFQSIIEKSKLKQGSRLIDSQYDQVKTNFTNLASQLGYLDAAFLENQIDVFPEDNTADINIHFDTGVRYAIERVDIIQTPYFLDESFIRKLVAIKAGELISNDIIFKLRRKLSATGYFDQVSIDLDYAHKNSGKIPLQVKLTPGNRIKYSAGIGFSTDIGPRVTLEYKQDRFTDFGYQFNSKLNLSTVVSEFSAGIKAPSKSSPASKWYNLDLGYRVERTDLVSSDTSKIGVSQTRIRDSKWQNVNYLDLVNEQFNTGGDESESLLLVPGTSWSYIKADNPAFPTKGYKIQTDFRGASSSILSDVSFAQLQFEYKGITSIGASNRLIYRARLGTTLTDNLDDLPTSYRFFTGGDNTIRGFNYETLAPINSDGDIAGGKHMAVASIEFEHRFADQWAVAFFLDAGNTFNNDFNIEKSVGPGLRWFSPIGPVRIDLGIPINNEDNNFRIHFTLGPDL